MPALADVVERREGVMAELGKRFEKLRLEREDVKRILLAILFGANYINYTPGIESDFLIALGKEVKAFALAVAHRHPDMLAKMVEWGKRNPEVSLLSYMAADRQRTHVEKMKLNVPEDRICSEERDGFVLYDPTSDIKVGANVPIVVEAYPAAAVPDHRHAQARLVRQADFLLRPF
jgi:hypothetical protein